MQGCSMADAPTPALWASLREARPVHDDALTTASAGTGPNGCELLFAVDRRSELHLLIPVDSGPPGDKPADLQGLRVRHRHLEGGVQYLDLIAGAAHERLFSPFSGEVLSAVIDQGRRPWDAVAAIMRAWQSAWKPTVPNMAKTVQVGLFGELLTLEKIMIPALGPPAVHLWSGPDSERHDFVGMTLHLEVKTTRKSRHEHEISRLDQLRVPCGRRLVLVSVLVEESAAGVESVGTKMEEVADLIRADATASDAFQAKMVQLGWSDGLRRSGELLRFHLRDANIYEVNDSFPRLPDDFEPPKGVVAIRYTVDLANVPSIDVDDAIGLVHDDTSPT
jgi:hypothetical protein